MSLCGNIGILIIFIDSHLFTFWMVGIPLDSLAGIATHYVPSERLAALEDRLSELETDNHDVINMAIEDFVSEPLHDHKYALSDDRDAIDRCFRFNTIEE